MHNRPLPKFHSNSMVSSTRCEQFFNEMNRVVPWAELVTVIEPVYPKADGPGLPPVWIERMLRLHCLQLTTAVNSGRHE